jgi:serine/threonine-protein kinase
MRSTLFICFLATTCWNLVGFCSADDVAIAARDVLRDHCYQCHNGPGSVGGDVNFFDRREMIQAGFIEPNVPDESYLLQRIIEGSMPPLEQRERNPLTDTEIEVVRKWIEAGAGSLSAKEEERDFLALDTVLRGVLEYLQRQNPADRPFLRFFTLHHLYNSPSTAETDLRLYRAALSKSLNSLNWSAELVLPEVIVSETNDLHGTILAIDLRSFIDRNGRNWADSDHWSAVTQQYPYGLSYPDFTEDNRQQLMKEIGGLLSQNNSVTQLPILRADWFVATATRPPLYHTLLDLPDNAGQLEQVLGVDLAAAMRQPTPSLIARAGFARSGVSSQNRMVERSRAKHGSYWKSYDFKPGAKTASLVRFPLGPLNLFQQAQHPFAHQAFEHDGGEIIFTLPNGLQAYLLIDGENQRIDSGPIDVVSDALKTSGTPAIVNGLSCMACHRHGMINVTDEIRHGSGVFGDPRVHVDRLYPEKSIMDNLIQRDRDAFMSALDRATSPYWTTSPEGSKPLAERPEPIGEVARLYRLVYLDAETIAAELDFVDPEAILARAGDRVIKELGLESVMNGNGVVSRNVWEASDGLSLMQDLALESGMTPVR